MNEPTPAKKRAPRRTHNILEDPALAEASHEEEASREAAFQSGSGDWFGQPLHPFTSGRESAFYQQRHAAGAVNLWDALEDGYAFFGDAIRVLYFCSHLPAEWETVRAKPLEWQRAIDAWGDVHVPGSRKVDAIRITRQILIDSGENRHETAPDPTAKADAAGK